MKENNKSKQGAVSDPVERDDWMRSRRSLSRGAAEENRLQLPPKVGENCLKWACKNGLA